MCRGGKGAPQTLCPVAGEPQLAPRSRVGLAATARRAWRAEHRTGCLTLPSTSERLAGCAVRRLASSLEDARISLREHRKTTVVHGATHKAVERRTGQWRCSAALHADLLHERVLLLPSRALQGGSPPGGERDGSGPRIVVASPSPRESWLSQRGERRCDDHQGRHGHGWLLRWGEAPLLLGCHCCCG